MQIAVRHGKVIDYCKDVYICIDCVAINNTSRKAFDDCHVYNVQSIPTDIDDYDYYYINGKFIKEDIKGSSKGAIDTSGKERCVGKHVTSTGTNLNIYERSIWLSKSDITNTDVNFPEFNGQAVALEGFITVDNTMYPLGHDKFKAYFNNNSGNAHLIIDSNILYEGSSIYGLITVRYRR